MAVEQLKIQLEFRMGGDGWSEIFYTGGSSPKGAQSFASALVAERLKILVSVARIHHVRISGVQPGARSFRFPPTVQAGSVVPAKTRDVGGVTSNIGLYSATGVFRKLSLHGLPDEGHRYNEDGTERTALPGSTKAFLQYLVDKAFLIKHIAKAANDDTLPEVADITVAGGKVSFLGTFAGVVAKQKVRISGCKGYNARQFNGVWTVGELIVGPPAGFKAQTKRLIDPQFTYLQSTGRLRNAMPAGYTFVAIEEFDPFDNNATRKVGRPTDSPRGRRSLTR